MFPLSIVNLIKMKIIKADDQMFGNQYMTTIKLENEELILTKMRPHVAWGCNGIAKIDKDWHFFDEDDGHYWTSFIMSDDEFNEINNAITELSNSIIDRSCSNKKPRFNFKNGIPKIKGSFFNFHYEFEGKKITLIEILIRGESKVKIHPFWLKDIERCFSLKERPPLDYDNKPIEVQPY